LVDKSVFSYKKINDYYHNNPYKVTPNNDPEDQMAALIGSLNLGSGYRGSIDMPNVNLKNTNVIKFLVRNLDEYKNVNHIEIYNSFDKKQKHDYFNSGGHKGIPNDKYIDILKVTKLNNNNIKWVIRNVVSLLGDKSDLNFLDVSEITVMVGLFRGKFNGDISKWDVGNVTDMSHMFHECENFNSDISKWNVSNVTDMSFMFYGCKKFNGDLSKWNVGNVTNMSHMFYECENFNSDISKWNIRKVVDIGYIFDKCLNFEQNLSKWHKINPNFEGVIV
jgi:surface protein